MLYHNSIPCSHFVDPVFLQTLKKTCDLNAPAGVDLNKLANLVAGEVARTIRHEQAHKERWQEFYLTHRKDLKQVNISEEESFAEQKEREVPDQPNDISGGSEDTESMTNEKILDLAVNLLGKYSQIQIPRESIEDAKLGPDRQGEFQMTQGPDDVSESGMIAIDPNTHKLKVDVDKIIQKYNNAIQGYYKNVKPTSGPTPTTTVPVSPPTSGGAVPSVPSAPVVPSVGAR